MLDITIYIPLRGQFKHAHKLMGNELWKARTRPSQNAKQSKRLQIEQLNRLNTVAVQKALDKANKRNRNKRRRLTAIQEYNRTREFRTVSAIQRRAKRHRVKVTVDKIVYSTKS